MFSVVLFLHNLFLLGCEIGSYYVPKLILNSCTILRECWGYRYQPTLLLQALPTNDTWETMLPSLRKSQQFSEEAANVCEHHNLEAQPVKHSS